MSNKPYQVIVVGGGPVGVGLAIELGLRNISVALIERYPSPQPIPKGQNLTQRTLEHFYFWGIEDKVRAARAMPDDYPIGGGDRLWQPNERVLVRLAETRARSPLLLYRQRALTPIRDGKCTALPDG